MRTGELIAGRYRLKEMVGTGGMGEVWRAGDEQDGREVALKRPARGADADSERTRRQLRREARNAAKLNHPHIVAFIDEIIEGPERWLVMEYVPSQSLAQLLERCGTLPPQYVTHIGAQIASALEAVHARGILHRDVKPGNILVTQDGTAKLTDFGISRSICGDATTESAVVGGTVAFMPSEVANGRTPTMASDVFSLGATLFAAVEGIPPFGNADNGWHALRLAADYKLLPTSRAGPLTPILAELLRREPLRRPDAAAARDLLQNLATTLTGERGPLPWPVRKPRSPWRSRRRAVTIAGCLAAPLIVAGVVVTTPDNPASTNPRPVADTRSADPCGLTDTAVLARFGIPIRYPALGNFNRCDIYVNAGNNVLVDVKVELQLVAEARPQPAEDDTCTRTLRPASRNQNPASRNQNTDQVTITVRPVPGHRAGDSCAMADVARQYADTVLRRGAIPRRSTPLNPTSLGRLSACGMLNSNELTRVLGPGPLTTEFGFGDWHCRWKSTTSELVVSVFFDQDQWTTLPTDGLRTKIGDLDGNLIPIDGDPIHKPGKHSCGVKVGNPRVVFDAAGKNELLRLEVHGPQPADQLCGPARELGAAAVARLPR